MTLSAILCCIWVIASSLVAMLPMRLQYAPGLCLLLLAPVLLAALTYDYGVLVGVLATLGFVSMFRHPLAFLARKLWRAGDGVRDETQGQDK
ncbi:MAG: DUF2484 family protein [Pseudomonadota bacterium]